MSDSLRVSPMRPDPVRVAPDLLSKRYNDGPSVVAYFVVVNPVPSASCLLYWLCFMRL